MKLITILEKTEIFENTKIKLISNPKRPGSAAYDRYKKYEKSTTVAEYLKHATRADLKYDYNKNFLKLT